MPPNQFDNSKIIWTARVDSDGNPTAAGDASEATLLAIDAEIEGLRADFNAPAASIPNSELDDTTDLSVGNVSRTDAGETTMVSATASQYTTLYRYAFTVPGPGTVEIRDGTSGAVLRKHVMPALGGLERVFEPKRHYAKTSVNTALVFYWSGSGEANIDFDYVKAA